MLVYAHGDTVLERRNADALRIPAGTWTEIADLAAEKILTSGKYMLCDVTNEPNPPDHRCDYLTTMMPVEQSVYKNRVRLSPQKRLLLQQARHRSRTARLATRA